MSTKLKKEALAIMKNVQADFKAHPSKYKFSDERLVVRYPNGRPPQPISSNLRERNAISTAVNKLTRPRTDVLKKGASNMQVVESYAKGLPSIIVDLQHYMKTHTFPKNINERYKLALASVPNGVTFQNNVSVRWAVLSLM